MEIKKFKNELESIAYLEKYESFYNYWQNSASTSTEKSNKIIIEV